MASVNLKLTRQFGSCHWRLLSKFLASMHELEQILSVLVQGRQKQGAGAIFLNPRFLENYKQTLFSSKTYLLIYRLLPTLLHQTFHGLCCAAGQLEFHLSAILPFATVSAKSCQWSVCLKKIIPCTNKFTCILMKIHSLCDSCLVFNYPIQF